MCHDRCADFDIHLLPGDRLVVGQDGPSEAEGSISQASYETEAYDDFFTTYLEGIQEHAGIAADARTSWKVTSKMDMSMHYFEVVALARMACVNFDNYVVEPGTVYKMFKSWKRGEEEICGIAESNGLQIEVLGKASGSGMRQYLVSPSPSPMDDL